MQRDARCGLSVRNDFRFNGEMLRSTSSFPMTINYHMLADFRTGHPVFLDELLTDTIAKLMHQGVVTLKKVGQDGMRVRASAGNGSFRREKTLKKCREEAARQVQKLRDESEDESASDASKARQTAARSKILHNPRTFCLKDNTISMNDESSSTDGQTYDCSSLECEYSSNQLVAAAVVQSISSLSANSSGKRP